MGGIDCPLPLDIAESYHKFCRGNEKPSIGSTGPFTEFCVGETSPVNFPQKRLLIWLYKSIDGSSLTRGKTYGTIWQYPMTIRIAVLSLKKRML
jgi:hypothetical protein